MRFLWLFLFLASTAFGRDLTPDYDRVFKKQQNLTTAEVGKLYDYQFALVPGILAESFIREDRRSTLEFSILTSDYFGSQMKLLQENGLDVTRIQTSSFSVEETKSAINELLKNSTKKVIFISHSLGGMGLLDHLIKHEDLWPKVGGIIFLQSPFGGAPVASVLANSPWPVKKLLAGIGLFLNTSEETLEYLSVENRQQYVDSNEVIIKRLVSAVPVITVGGIANGHVTLFVNSANVIRWGCLTPVFRKCFMKVYDGPYYDNDGMVPFASSRLPGADFVRLLGVDHGETVLNDYVNTIDRVRMTETLLKLLVKKLPRSM